MSGRLRDPAEKQFQKTLSLMQKGKSEGNFYELSLLISQNLLKLRFRHYSPVTDKKHTK
jgi:hypothetical protein